MITLVAIASAHASFIKEMLFAGLLVFAIAGVLVTRQWR